MFLSSSDIVSDKVYLLAIAQGGCVLSKSVLEGKGGVKLEYQFEEFRRLGQMHVGVHCSEAFCDLHPAFLKVLAWALERGGWRKLKATSLDKQRSITLLAERDPQAKKLMAKSLHTFGKDTFAQYLTEKCQVKEKSFFVAKLRGWWLAHLQAM